MHFSFSAFVALAACMSVLAQDTSPNTPTQSKEAFDKATIPNDLQLKFEPKGTLAVTFPQQQPEVGEAPAPVAVQQGGQELFKNVTELPPQFQVSTDVGQGPFVVAIVDPDAKADEKTTTDGPVRTFLGGGFELKEDGTLTNSTPAITEYEKPDPEKGSTPHRYVFLVYKQPDGFTDQKEVTADTLRTAFNVSGFAQKVGLGDPVAGTFVLVAPLPSDDKAQDDKAQDHKTQDGKTQDGKPQDGKPQDGNPQDGKPQDGHRMANRRMASLGH